MWGTIFQKLCQYLFFPLILKGISSLADYFLRKKKEEQTIIENQKKADAYEQAKTPADAADPFAKLP
jgi:hypothetical protein